ncbi:MAG: 50S ribosomal protein L16 [Candidatus Nanoarchaeia archaeon]|nr:50S ribosomal protein L16 [Candidatus Nanoarchaeia archaeon]MDD5357804.1 50S ribosomal protein L16 [Candidatus Nanoarchaeia archaeon]MDD5588723.1 50S ribosomal protein L16 [Candidatus Nanoarchaeia archaeon]
MAMRRASAYSRMRVVPYTRHSKLQKRAYVKAVPPSKIVKFYMGDMKGYESGKYPYVLTVATDHAVQIRQNAIEACRQFIHRKLGEELKESYYFHIIPFTHHIQRENKMLTGAGADRMQKGMQLSFGKTIAKAAILKKNAPLFLIALPTPKATSFARHIVKQIKSKLPCKTRILFEDKNRGS